VGLTRRHLLFLAGTGLAGAPVAFYLADPFGSPRYRGPRSDHFDGREFHNLEPTAVRGFRDLLCWRRTSRPGPWSEWIDSKPGPTPESRVADLRVTHVNHSTVLIQMDGMNLLTDPVWSDRASPVSWAGPRRHRVPGLRFEDLPPIDVVLLSHDHYDHLDVSTLRRLAVAHGPRFVVPLGVGALLRSKRIGRVEELDWGQAAKGAPRISSVPAQHFSGRGLRGRNTTLWCGYVIEGRGGPVYFAGDTGWGPHLRDIRLQFGPVRLALLPVGAFLPRWFMAPVHLSPQDAVEAHRALEASTSVGIHYGTFRVADDGIDEPRVELERAAAGAGDPRFWLLPFGEGRDVPPLDRSSPLQFSSPGEIG
jgi:L-ascorbate metabolism protein UlaG (beta-lactamase superfamily)